MVDPFWLVAGMVHKDHQPHCRAARNVNRLNPTSTHCRNLLPACFCKVHHGHSLHCMWCYLSIWVTLIMLRRPFAMAHLLYAGREESTTRFVRLAVRYLSEPLSIGSPLLGPGEAPMLSLASGLTAVPLANGLILMSD